MWGRRHEARPRQLPSRSIDVVDDVGPVPLDHVEQERDEHSERAPSDRVERLPTIATTAPDEVYLQVVGVLIRTPLDRDRYGQSR